MQKFISTLGCLLVSLSVAQPAQPQAALASGVAVENIVAELKRGLEEIINQAESAYSRQAFDTRMHALIVLQNLDTVASGLVDTTFDKLDGSQKKLFQQVNGILNKWNSGNHDLAKDFDGIATTTEEAISRLPFADKAPLLKDFQPSYLLPKLAGETFSVKVRGVRIGEGEPTLKFVTTPCTLFSKTDRAVEFHCPTALFGNFRTVREQSGVLEVIAPKSFWDHVFFSETRKSYRIGVVGIPAQLGNYRVRAVVPTSTEEAQDRSQYFEHTNAHCSGNTNLNWPVNASEGWKIVESTVKTRPISVSSGCSGPSAESISSTGFRVTGKAVNTGNCVRAFGQTISRDGRGWVKGWADWTERKTVAKDGDVEVGVGTIEWGSDTAISLPKLAKAFVLSIVRIDGTVGIVTAPGVFDRYDVQYDDKSQTVVVKPASLAKAFGG